MFKLALRNVLRHRGRTALTLTIIVLGTMALIVSGGLIQDIYRQLADILIHAQTGHLQIARDGYFESGGRDSERYMIANADSLRRSIVAQQGVKNVMGRLHFVALLGNGKSDRPVYAEGVEPDAERLLSTHLRLVGGRALRANDRYGVMLGAGLARSLKLAPGDWANLMLTTPDGAMNTMEFEVVGVFQTFTKEYDARAIRLPMTAAQELLAQAGINTLVVVLHDTATTDALRQRLTRLTSEQDVTVKDWTELNPIYGQTVELYEHQFGILRLIILFLVMLSVANSVNMSVFERVGEFGTMMALGNRSHRIMQLILLESTLIGLAGAIIGSLLGILVSQMITAIGIPMPPPPVSDLPYTARVTLTPAVVIGAAAVGLGATVAAAVLPAWRVRRTPVVDALRQAI